MAVYCADVWTVGSCLRSVVPRAAPDTPWNPHAKRDRDLRRKKR